MQSVKAIVAGACALVASGAGVVAVLEYMDINPFKTGKTADVEAPNGKTVGRSITDAPTVAVPVREALPQSGAAAESETAPPVASAAPSSSSRLTVKLKSAQVARYSSPYYYASIRFEITNTTPNELKATWLRPSDLMTFTATSGTKFAGARPSMKAYVPGGLGWCGYADGQRCLERYPGTFTTLKSGESLTAVVTVLHSVPQAQRTTLPEVIAGTFSAPVYVVDTVTKATEAQSVTMDFELQNPEKL